MVGGQDLVADNGSGPSQRSAVAEILFACSCHAWRCSDEKQQTAVSGGAEMSLPYTAPCKDSSSSCGVLIISRNQAINSLLSLAGCEGFPHHLSLDVFNEGSNSTLNSHRICSAWLINAF